MNSYNDNDSSKMFEMFELFKMRNYYMPLFKPVYSPKQQYCETVACASEGSL